MTGSTLAWVTSSERHALVLCAALAICGSVRGEEVYLAPSDFVTRAFAPAQGRAETLWLDSAVQASARAILGHAYPAARLAYHGRERTTAWILEAIGKERPITLGIVVSEGRIAQVSVLVYRESRGWEVRLLAFTRQFEGAGLAGGERLDRDIDGITGATLSVRAVTGLARFALALHRASPYGARR